MRRAIPPIRFRSGATFWPFLIWALTLGAMAVFAEREALSRPAGLPRWAFHGLFAAGLLLGPVSFGVQMLRRLLLSVHLDPSLGIVLRGDRLLPWSDIQSVVHHPNPFNKSTDFLGSADVEDEILHTPTEVVSLVVLFRSLLSIFYYLVMPPLLLLSPWHPRVILHLRGGTCLILRDLERDGEFVYRVRKAIGSEGTRPGTEVPAGHE